MRIILVTLLTSFFLLSQNLAAQEVQCKDAYVDTIAVEGTREGDASSLSQTLLISFKTKNGQLHTCGGVIPLFVYLKADENPVVFNAMVSMAFMARANNYKVVYMVTTGQRLFTADKLAYLQIVENTAITGLQ